jgi:RHS repeat-associated protein
VRELQGGTVIESHQLSWWGYRVFEDRATVGGVETRRRYFDQGEVEGAVKRFYARDHLGSVRDVVDGNGASIARYDYDTFGGRTTVFANGGYSCLVGYTGHYVHSATGLYLAWYRAYEAGVGRWLNRDPIGERGGLNIYLYVKNRPLTFNDRLGLFDCPSKEISALIRKHMNFFKGLGKERDIELDGYLSGDKPFLGSSDGNTKYSSKRDDTFGFSDDPRDYVDREGKYPVDAGYHTHPPQGPTLGPDAHPSREDLLPDPRQTWPEIIIPINPDGSIGDEFPVLVPKGPGGWDIFRYHSGCK